MTRALDRRSFIAATGLGATSLASPARAAQKKPNIVLIMADDLGHECLGCYGGTSYETPVLDELAGKGVRFEHCHSTPLCTPSRVEIMTGQYNFRNYEKFGYLNPNQTTFANVLKKAGYETCIAGKWQLSTDNRMPSHFGFDEHCLWNMTRLPKDPARLANGRYAHPRIERNGKLLPDRVIRDGYGPDICCDFLTGFIRRQRSRPFLAYYPMILTHAPFVATPDSATWGDRKTRDAKDRNNFAGMVAYMDKLVGRIIGALDERGVLGNTLVLFVGDNGTHRTIESRMKGDIVVGGGKGMMTDAGTRVPLIAYWKGVTPKGRVLPDLVDFSDFMPVLADAAGARVPADITQDGRSFLPRLRGEPGNPREWIFCHYDPQVPYADFSEHAARFVRDQRYKLYHDGRLYDVSSDRLEKANIKPHQGSAETEAARRRFQAVLDSMPPWQPDGKSS